MAVWQTLKSAIVGVGVGEATADALTPILTPAAQDAWSKNPYKALAASLAAEMVAQGLTDAGSAGTEAALTGINPQRLAAMIQLALTAPSPAEVLDMARRNGWDTTDRAHAYRKAGLEPAWDAQYDKLRYHPYELSDLANGIQQAFVPNTGQLPPFDVSGAGSVSVEPPLSIDPVEEAGRAGFTADQLALRTRLAGLPPALHELLDLVRRGQITVADAERGLAQGHTKTEWTAALLALVQALLPPHEYIVNRLRGWNEDVNAMYAGGALTGHTPDQMDLMFQNQGRPLSWHQIWIGLQRGGVYDGPLDEIDPAFLKGLRESDIRPEWYNLAWHSRYTLPAAFVLRQMLKDGFDPAEGKTILLGEGWYPPYADEFIKLYAPTASAAPSPHVKSANTSALTEVKNAYAKGDIDKPTAGQYLTALGVTPDEQTDIFTSWDVIRSLKGSAVDTTGGTPH